MIYTDLVVSSPTNSAFRYVFFFVVVFSAALTVFIICQNLGLHDIEEKCIMQL